MKTITSTDGLTLEAAWTLPDDARAVVVMCHPHPRMSGTMNAPLLVALHDDLIARRIGVLRFNFRGVGSSQGRSEDGTPEIADAEGALAAAAEKTDVPRSILGWSFGGAVAVRTAQRHPELAACVAIAPAVTARPGYTVGLPAPGELGLEMPILVVTGANDEQIHPDDQRAWAEAAGARSVLVKGANHFFWARYEALAKAVGDFLAEVVSG